MKYIKLFTNQIRRRDGDTTLKPRSTIGIRTQNDDRLPMSVFTCFLTTAAMVCVVKMLTGSFAIFGKDSAEPARILFTKPEIARFYFLVVVGCLVICAVNALHRHSIKATFTLLAVYAGVFAAHYKYIADGFIRALNKGVYEIAAVMGQRPRQYYLTYFDLNEPKTELLWFMYAVIFGACFLLAYFGVRRCSALWFTAVVMACAGFPLALNCLTGESWFIAAFVVCIVMYTVNTQGYRRSGSKSTVTGIGKTLGIYGKYAAVSAFQQSVIMLIAAFITVFAVYQLNDFSDYEKSPSAEKLGQDIIYSVEEFTMGTPLDGLGFGTASSLNRGQLSNAGDLDYTGRTMFEISSTSRETLYMRSYSAAVYSGKRWEQPSASAYASYDFWQELRDSGFYPQFVFPQGNMHAELADDGSLTLYTGADPTDTVELSIRNKALNHKLFLTDYRLLPELSEDALNAAYYKFDGSFKFDKFGGLDSYKETISTYGTNVSSEAVGIVTTFTDAPQGMYDILHDGDFDDMTYMLSSFWTEDEDAEYAAFLRRENKYRAFVAENYLSYPDGITDYLPEGFDDNVLRMYQNSVYGYEGDANAMFHVDNYYSAVSEYIRTYLHDNAEYTLTPGKTPRGEDFVEYFLNENHQGYCVHFATAAVLMLRRAGIPARYCEGYFVSEKQLDERGSYTKIADSAAHAWAEVYYPLSGWQPVEFTPYYSNGEVPAENKPPLSREDISAESDADDSAGDTETDTETEEETDTESELEADTETETDSSTDRRASDTDTETTVLTTHKNEAFLNFLKAMISFFKKIALLLLAAALWLAARYAVCRVRRSRFESEDTRRAAVAMYHYALRVLRLMGLSVKKGEGEEAFAVRASRESHDVGSREMRVFTKSALKARFGQTPPEPEETAAMRGFIKVISENMYAKKPRWKKWLIKYVLFFD